MHDVLEDHIFCVEASKGYGEALRPNILLVSEHSARDQVNFVKNSIGHAR